MAIFRKFLGVYLNFFVDDYNIPLEIPILVQNLTDQQLDVVPDYKADYLTETHLIVSQRSFDIEQFVQRRAQQLCHEAQLTFFYCEDYDIKIIHVRFNQFP